MSNLCFLFENEVYEFVEFFLGVCVSGVGFAAHCIVPDQGETFVKNEILAVTFHDFLMGVNVLVDIASACVYAVVAGLILFEASFVEGNHVSPDLIYVNRVSVVHHIGSVAACGTHINLETNEIANLAKTLSRLCKTEEFKVNEASLCAERFDGCAAELAEGFGNLIGYVISKVKLFVYDIHDGRRPAGHGFEERVAVCIGDRIVRADITLYEFFHNVRDLRIICEEAVQVVFVFELVCTGSANTVVGLYDNGITTDVIDEFLCRLVCV